MDVICHKCGEPWDMIEVGEFSRQYDGGNQRDFHAGKGCPSCLWGEKAPKVQPRRAELASILTELLGDDIDGLACELEDAEMLGLFGE